MFGNNFQLLSCLLFTSILFGCAKPNYQDIPKSEKIVDQGFSKIGLQFSLEWDRQPSIMQYESFLLKFYSATDPNIGVDVCTVDSSPCLTPFVQLWMSSMGHGSSPATVEKVAGTTGQYRVSKVFFNMPGLWDLRIQLKEGSVVHEQVILQINL